MISGASLYRTYFLFTDFLNATYRSKMKLFGVKIVYIYMIFKTEDMSMMHFLVVLLFMFLGYLIKYRQYSWLIAGYNTSTKKQKEKYNQDALCRGVGNLAFILAGIASVGSIGEFFSLNRVMLFSWILFSIVIIVALINMNTANRYRK